MWITLLNIKMCNDRMFYEIDLWATQCNFISLHLFRLIFLLVLWLEFPCSCFWRLVQTHLFQIFFFIKNVLHFKVKLFSCHGNVLLGITIKLSVRQNIAYAQTNKASVEKYQHRILLSPRTTPLLRASHYSHSTDRQTDSSPVAALR